MRLRNPVRGAEMGNVRRADTFAARLAGLLFTDPEKDGRPLWIVPCSSIHTLGMRRPLDILFLDREMRVVKKVLKVKPMTLCVSCSKAHSVLEFFSGKWDPSSIEEGDALEVRED